MKAHGCCPWEALNPALLVQTHRVPTNPIWLVTFTLNAYRKGQIHIWTSPSSQAFNFLEFWSTFIIMNNTMNWKEGLMHNNIFYESAVGKRKQRTVRERWIPGITYHVLGPTQLPEAPFHPYPFVCKRSATSGVSGSFFPSQFYCNSRATWIMHSTHFFCEPIAHFIALLALWINFLSSLLK